MWNRFTFQPLENPHTGIYISLKACFVKFLSFVLFMEWVGREVCPQCSEQAAYDQKTNMLSASSALNASNKEGLIVAGFCVDDLKSDASFELDAQFSNEGVHGMPEGKSFQYIDTVSCFLSG